MKIFTINKYTSHIDKLLFEHDDINIVISKYRSILRYLKYCRRLSPNSKSHRKSNICIYKKLIHLVGHSNFYIHDMVGHNSIVVLNSEGRVMAPYRLHMIYGGFIPNDPLHMEERNKERLIVHHIIESEW